MGTNPSAVYPLYQAYVAELHHALSMIPSGPVGERYRVKLLPLSEFWDVWERWAKTPGRQEEWLARFSAGYKVHEESVLRKLDAALAKNEKEREAA